VFRELYAIARTAVLTLTVSADEKSGQMTINVIPKPKKDLGEPALAKPLSITATPEEFDAGFGQALLGYQASRLTLQEQVEATNEVLEAAKSASAKKAADAAIKASKPQTKEPSKKAVSSTEPEDDKSVEEDIAAVDQPQLFA